MRETNFKQTEIGLIPLDWNIKELHEISSTSSGGTPSRRNSSYYQGSIRWFTTSELNDCTLYDSKDHITEEAIMNSSAKIFPKGTLLMAMYGATIGKLGVLSNESATNQACCAIFCEEIDVMYLFYYLLQNRNRIIELGIGAAQPNISQSIINHLVIGLPTHKEQKKIGNLLSQVEKLISILKNLIEKKHAIKAGAMSQLLSGKLRLPGFSEPWVDIKIGDLSSVVPGATPSTDNPEYWNGIIRWMNSGELNLKYVKEVENRITKFGYDATSTHILPKYCVLLGLAGQGKTRGTAAINLIELCTNQSIAAILPSAVHDSFFLYHLLDFKYQDLRTLSSGDGTRGGLTKKQIENFVVPLPNLEEQKAIAKVLTDMDEEISALKAKLKKYEQLKKGMMQQLLTGKIRLVSPNESLS